MDCPTNNCIWTTADADDKDYCFCPSARFNPHAMCANKEVCHTTIVCPHCEEKIQIETDELRLRHMVHRIHIKTGKIALSYLPPRVPTGGCGKPFVLHADGTTSMM